MFSLCPTNIFLAYVLVSGFFPFNADDDAHMLRTILACKWTFFSPAFDNVSQAAKDFIARLIVADPTKRLTAEQALRHRWFHPHAMEDAQLFDLTLGQNAHDHTNLHHAPAWAQDVAKHAEVDELIAKIQDSHNWVGLDTEIDHEGVDLVWPEKGEHYVGERYQELQNTLAAKRKDRDISVKPNAHEAAQTLLRQMNQTGQLPPHKPPVESPQPALSVQLPQSIQSAPSPHSAQSQSAQPIQEVPVIMEAPIQHPRPQEWTHLNQPVPLPLEGTVQPGPEITQPRSSSLGPRTPSPQPSTRTNSGLISGKGGGFLYKLFHPKSLDQRVSSDSSTLSNSSMDLNATTTMLPFQNVNTLSLPHSTEGMGSTMQRKDVTSSPKLSGVSNLMQNLRNSMAGYKKLKIENLDTGVRDISLGRISPLNVDGDSDSFRMTSDPSRMDTQ